MAELVNEREEQEEADSIEAQDSMVEETPVEQPDDDVPEKYQGKSVKELVQMHQEAEKRMGKQGSEVGELRKIVDTYIQSQLKPKAEEPPEEKADWFADPDKALEQRLNEHPSVKKAEQFEQEYRKNTALERLQKAHPDMGQIVTDPNFSEWIQASKFRTQLFVEADQNYDYDAANELFNLYKETQPKATETKKETDAAEELRNATRQEQVKKASTGSARGSSSPSRKKKYRRSDIMKLKNSDPDKYDDMADEILLAYREGRVV